ncbi:MAG: sialidase family protein [Candidatus Bathyarchaeia archaeon]
MIVHWVDNGEIVASRGYTLYVSKDSETFRKLVNIRIPPLYKVISHSRLLSRALRLGIRALLKLKNGDILLIANGKMFLHSKGASHMVYSFEHGVGPLRDGLCEDDNGNIYIGEYFPNNSRKHPVRLLKSEDGGRSWEVLQSFKNIRHIHCVQYDPYEKLLWMGTGDRDEESKIMFSEDYGETWNVMGSGNQMFRTVTLLFTEEYVYWGTDTPARQSYIYRYIRKRKEVERLTPVSGPVYCSTILENGIKVFSTGAEGNSEGKSAAWDNKAHIWASLDGVKYEDVISFEKDSWPYILGYGRIIFPRGQKSKMLIFTTQCLKNNDNTSFMAYLSGNGNH